ncbi:MAG: hypothetical protein ACLSHU_14115 [Oscillospiraceae bacterium]
MRTNLRRAWLFQYFDENSTLDGYHQELMQTIHQCRRTDVKDPSSDMMDRLVRLPRPILRLVMHTLFFLDRHGKVPQGIIATDPNYSSYFYQQSGFHWPGVRLPSPDQLGHQLLLCGHW